MAHMNIAKKQPANRPLPVIPHPVKAPKIAAQPKAQAPAAKGVGQFNNALQNRVVIVPKQPAAPKAQAPIDKMTLASQMEQEMAQAEEEHCLKMQEIAKLTRDLSNNHNSEWDQLFINRRIERMSSKPHGENTNNAHMLRMIDDYPQKLNNYMQQTKQLVAAYEETREKIMEKYSKLFESCN